MHRVPALGNGPASSCSSTGPRASRRTTATCSARRRRSAACSSRPASTRSASSRRAAPARCSPTGSRDGHPPMDLWDVDIRRCMPFQRNRRYLKDRTVEALGLLYAMHWPFRQPETARGVRRSPLHDRLPARGACFGEVAGWERPELVRAAGHRGRHTTTATGARTGSPTRRAEHRAVREGVGLFDQSSFGKFVVAGRRCRSCPQPHLGQRGRRAGRQDRLHAMAQRARRHRGRPDGHARGENRFLIVTAAATQTRDLAWLRRHIPRAPHAVVPDVTSAYAVLGVMGPQSRALLAG